MPANLLFDTLLSGKPAGQPALLLDDGSSLTYGDLLDRTGQLASRLVALGVAPGDRVAAQVEKSATALLLYLACVRVGGVYLPLNTAYTPAEVGYFLGDAEPALFVCDPARLDRLDHIARDAGARLATLDPSGREGTLMDGVDDLDRQFDNVPRDGADLAAILYTSGTTGRSKGAMLTHGNLLSNAETLVKEWHFVADDELLHALPVYHTHGLFVGTNVPLLAGARIRLLARFEPDAIVANLPTATVMMGVPTFYTRLLADGRMDRAMTKNMRLFVCGSAPLLAETHRAWEGATGHVILERYGMTETNMNTSNPYDGERRPGTVGPALPGVSVRVVRESDRVPLPAGEVGMVEVKGPNVFVGYWRMPDKTAAELCSDGYFITGDLGRLSDDDYLEIVGRGKDLVITGGLNVYPKEVEEQIDALDGVEESAVIGLPDADFGEAVTAAVVRTSGSTIGEADILSQLATQLARFKLPKRVVFLDTLPRNTMGKVQKNMLRGTLAES